eukprot:TRINITY_DN915_c2_g1_i2.p1 TRINITY_DN915_c2_g1~~TRINITY_DN915_c2_g1_i2.p1  ORF type:complete len:429 (+),score=144.14 TRINITY_DN915_c2_g1_i2:457-1743(+)
MARIVDYTSFISRRSSRRKPSAIRELQPLLAIPGMISLGGGMPTASLFPIDRLSISLKTGANVELTGPLLDKALQYSPSYGLPELIDLLKRRMEQEHHLTDNGVTGWDICVTTGSQDALSKAFDVLINEGDYVLVEEPCYSGSLAALQPIGCNLVGIKTDADGLIPDDLERVLSSWPFDTKPLRVLYLIPNGQNPSGSTLSHERKLRVYELARQYNLLIMEDDPYYYLQLPTAARPTVVRSPTLLSMDVDGRVLRFESFSKIISSGLRVGFVTGPKALVERVQLDQQATVLHPSGVSQAILYTILSSWGADGWEKQLLAIQETYTKRRDALIRSAERHLQGLAEWHTPSAGMFVWFKLLGIEDSFDLIKKKAVEEKFVMVPGKPFSTSDAPSPYVRASYSTSTDEEMDLAVQRLATLLRRERGLPAQP